MQLGDDRRERGGGGRDIKRGSAIEMGKHSSFVVGQWMFSDSECARRGLAFFAKAAQIELSFLRTFPYISVALQPSGRAREEERNVTARVHTGTAAAATLRRPTTSTPPPLPPPRRRPRARCATAFNRSASPCKFFSSSPLSPQSASVDFPSSNQQNFGTAQ